MIHVRDLNSNENTDEYFRAMDDEIQSLMIRYTWEIVSRKSVADHNMIPGTWSLKFKKKSDYTIRKFKARYYVRGDIQNILSPKPPKLVFSNGPEGHSEVDVDFVVYYRFAKSKY